MKSIKLTPFTKKDAIFLIEWIDSPELLVTIAGDMFSYPLTSQQLQHYIDDPSSHSLNVVMENKVVGHAEIILVGDKKGKLDKIIIGDKNQRGKGIGGKLMFKLLEYAFNELSLEEIELYVYDWNVGGIKCYEKVGFTIQRKNTLQTVFGENHWTALQMTISKAEWNEKAYHWIQKNSGLNP